MTKSGIRQFLNSFYLNCLNKQLMNMQPEDQKNPVNCTPDFCIKPDAEDVSDFQKIEINKEAIEAFQAKEKKQSPNKDQ